MPTTAGQLDRKITIQRSTATYNDLNEPVETWNDFITVSAKRRDASDRQRIEMMAAGQVGSFLASRFTIRSSVAARTVKPTDRLIHEGLVWTINGVKEADEGRFRFIEIAAIKDAD